MDVNTDIVGLQTITRIWASFHFLPYDLYAEKKKCGKRYRNKYRLICRPNGDLLVDTVTLAKDKGLPAAGIAMHILADTWAHQYFPGSGPVHEGCDKDPPGLCPLIYLSVLFGFAGLVDVLHSLESRRVGGSWRFNLSHGILNIILAGICLFFIRTGRLVEVIYGISLISSAILRIISATRRTAVVYIA